MKEWFYQIKTSTDKYGGLEWHWPPVLSGKIASETKAEARALIDNEYSHIFPMRVLKKDIEKGGFLLKIDEIVSDRKRALFDIKHCKECQKTFLVIDSYNDIYQRYKGPDFCSDECHGGARERERVEYRSDTNFPPVIYKIENIKTGKCYVGKTTQAFTLRWWQHFSGKSETKFSKEINSTPITDWIFSIIEVVTPCYAGHASIDSYIAEREQFHIDANDSIKTGYNSSIAKQSEREGGLI